MGHPRTTDVHYCMLVLRQAMMALMARLVQLYGSWSVYSSPGVLVRLVLILLILVLVLIVSYLALLWHY